MALGHTGVGDKSNEIVAILRERWPYPKAVPRRADRRLCLSADSQASFEIREENRCPSPLRLSHKTSVDCRNAA
jgi:hypothetical protein